MLNKAFLWGKFNLKSKMNLTIRNCFERKTKADTIYRSWLFLFSFCDLDFEVKGNSLFVVGLSNNIIIC